jgi:hypothetical protein
MVPTVDEILQQIIIASEAEHVRESLPEVEESLWAV